MSQYDVVIIGSGLGGLVCGYILSKEGYNVCILEKNKQLGGCLQTFTRNGCVFDTGMHYVGSLDEGQVLHKFFKYFGIHNKVKVKKLDENAFDIISFEEDGRKYNLANGLGNHVETLCSYFPEERANLVKYASRIKEICESLSLYNLREVNDLNIFESDYVTQSTTSFINSITTNSKLRNILAGNNSLYAGVPDKTPLFIHALISNFYINSAYRFVDGGDQVALLLAEAIKSFGGTILNNSKVTNLIIENQDITCAKLANGESVHGTYFISDVHPATTLKLIHPEFLQKSYRNRLNSIENTVGAFTVYAILKPESFKYLNSNIYHFRKYNVWDCINYTTDDWPRGMMLSTPPSSKSEEYADCVLFNTYMRYDEIARWENTYIEKRGEEYLEFKRNKAERMIDEANKLFPGLKSKIVNYYTSTPLTYRDYVGTKEGSMYGYEKDCNNIMKSYIPPRTKVPNLLLTGQNIKLHGMLGVPINALQTCGELVGLNYIIRKINEAQ